jgi:hypothetical protein
MHLILSGYIVVSALLMLPDPDKDWTPREKVTAVLLLLQAVAVFFL